MEAGFVYDPVSSWCIDGVNYYDNKRIGMRLEGEPEGLAELIELVYAAGRAGALMEAAEMIKELGTY